MKFAHYVMLPFALTLLSLPAGARQSPSDPLFDQYAGEENYTYVNIGSGLVHSELLIIKHADQSSVISVRGMFDKKRLSDFRKLTRCAKH